MCGDNRYVNNLRILAAIELYVNPEFYGQHPIFTLLLNNNPSVFNSIDTILAISVFHNALDTDKTKAKFAQLEALNICSACRWFGFLCVLTLSPVSLSTVQCHYKSFGSSLRYRTRFNQLIQPHRADYFSSEKIHLLFCSSLFDPQCQFVTIIICLLLCVLMKHAK